MHIIDTGKRHVEICLTSEDKRKLYNALRPEIDCFINGHTVKNAVLYAIVLGMYYATGNRKEKV